MTAPAQRGGIRDLIETRKSTSPDRELWWIDINERVLARAADRRLPLLERVKFLAIAGGNLDGFFELLVARLRARAERALDVRAPVRGTSERPPFQIRDRVLSQIRAEESVFAELREELEHAGIRLAAWADISMRDRSALRSTFARRIFPLITPLSVGPAHPFPSVPSLSLNLAVLLRDPSAERDQFAVVNLPPMLGRLLPLESGEGLVLVEEVVSAHFETLFPGVQIQSHSPFRVARADFALERREAEHSLATVGSGVTRRGRRTDAVRLEIDSSMPRSMLEFLMSELDVEDEDVYLRGCMLDPAFLWELYELDRPEPRRRPWIAGNEAGHEPLSRSRAASGRRAETR